MNLHITDEFTLGSKRIQKDLEDTNESKDSGSALSPLTSTNMARSLRSQTVADTQTAFDDTLPMYCDVKGSQVVDGRGVIRFFEFSLIYLRLDICYSSGTSAQ